uniref:hypothetical protein n=1 Tax=Fusobacterium mortiferum TaxID=850 RepID=UPI003FF09F13
MRDLYKGNTFKEYEITIAGGLEKGEEAELILETIVDKEITNNYNNKIANISQYVLFDDRSIAYRDLYTLNYDMGSRDSYSSNGNVLDSVKHFEFKNSDSKYSYLGKSDTTAWDSEISIEWETGNGGVAEGVESFRKYNLGQEEGLKDKNTLNLDAVNTLNIRVKHDGFITLWTDVGVNEKWVSLSKAKKDIENQTPEYYPVKAGEENKIEFYLKSYQFTSPDDLTDENREEFLNNKTLRIRYSPRQEDIGTYNEYSPMGEVEDYNYFIMPPVQVTFQSWKDKGVLTDIENPNREDNLWGVEDLLWTPGEIINQKIRISNITSTDITETSTDILNRSRIKFVSNNGDIDISKWNVKLFVNYSTEPLPDSKDRVTVEKKATGEYYFKFNKLDGAENLDIDFDFEITRESTSGFIQNEMYVLERKQDEIGFVDEGEIGADGYHKKKLGHNIDGGYAGWHYKVKEEPHLGTSVIYDGMNNRRNNQEIGTLTNTANTDNNGIIKINGATLDSGVTELSLATEVENSLTFKASHEGFIQAWLEIRNPDDADQYVHYPLFKDESDSVKAKRVQGGNIEETFTFMLPNEYTYKVHDDKDSNASTPNPKNQKLLKIRYGQIEEQVNRFYELNPSIGTIDYVVNIGSTGEAEDHYVNIIDSIDTYFAGYEELGVEVEDLTNDAENEIKIYGLKDGEVGYGERVRQSFIIENRGHQPLTISVLENKRVRFTSNNGIIELDSKGNINTDRLNLQVWLEEQDVTAENYVTLLRESDGSYLFKVEKELPAKGKLKISFNYFVNNDNNNHVINNLYYINCYQNLKGKLETYHKANTDVERDKQLLEKNQYPQMKKDRDNIGRVFSYIGSSNTSEKKFTSHFKVKENPILGANVNYSVDTNGESLTATTNDGIEIIKVATYIDQKAGDNTGKPTMFTGEWNDIVVKPKEKGYVTFWLDNTWNSTTNNRLNEPIQLPIRKDNVSSDNDNSYYEPLIVEPNEKIEVKIPEGIYRMSGNNTPTGTLTVRYSLVEDEVRDLKRLSRVGEVEEYTVRVMPPIEARFLSPEDYGIQLNSSADENSGEIIGSGDDILSMRELFEERIQFRNLHNKTTQPQNIVIESNVAKLSTNYYNRGISAEFEKADISDENQIVEDSRSSSNDDLTLTMHLILGSKEEQVIRVRRQIDDMLEHKFGDYSDGRRWRVYDVTNIGSIKFDAGYSVNSFFSTWNEPDDPSKGIYNIMERDYENASTYHDYYTSGGGHRYYDYYKFDYNSSQHYSGTRAYMVKSIGTNESYSSLGATIKKEDKPINNSWLNGSNNGLKDSDDDGVAINPTDNLQKTVAEPVLYHRANNKLVIRSSEDGYVSIWIWSRDNYSAQYYWGAHSATWKEKGWQLYHYSDPTTGQASEVSPTTTNANGTPIDINQGYSSSVNHTFKVEKDKANEIELYLPQLETHTVIRVKFSLERNDLGHDSATEFIRAGEIEDYKVQEYDNILELVKIGVEELGITYQDETNTIVYEKYDPENEDSKIEESLSFKEDFNFKFTIKNKSPARNYIKFGNGTSYAKPFEVDRGKVITEITDEDQSTVTTETATSIITPGTNPGGGENINTIIELKNMPPSYNDDDGTVDIKYQAKVIQENDIRNDWYSYGSYDYYYERRNEYVNWRYTYWWHGYGETFWYFSPNSNKAAEGTYNTNQNGIWNIKLAEDKFLGKNLTKAEHWDNSSGYSSGNKYHYRLQGQGDFWEKVKDKELENYKLLEENRNTARNYGLGLVGYMNTTNEARHYMARDENGEVMRIGDKILFKDEVSHNSLSDEERISPDGLTIFYEQEHTPGYRLLYSGVENQITLTVSHPGYVSFFINDGNDAENRYNYPDPTSGNWGTSGKSTMIKATRLSNDTPDPEPDPKPNKVRNIKIDAPEPIKVEAGANKIEIAVPEYPEGTRILRIRYAADPEEIKSPVGPASTGEVQDNAVYIRPLDTGFKYPKDLGVYSEYTHNNPDADYIETMYRLGYQDKAYQYGELYSTQFSMINTSSNFDHENSTAVLETNVSQLLDDDIRGKHKFSPLSDEKNYPVYYEIYKEIALDGDVDQQEFIIDSSGRKGEGLDDQYIADKTPIITKEIGEAGEKKYKYTIVIPKLLKNEKIRIKLWMLVTDEDIANEVNSKWQVVNKLNINGDIQSDQVFPVMSRDYGSGYLVSNGENDKPYLAETRNYLLYSDSNKAKMIALDGNMTTENSPFKYNGETNDPAEKETGVTFLESVAIGENFEEHKVIYNNLINILKVIPSHKGYLSFWINKDNKTWNEAEDSTEV